MREIALPENLVFDAMHVIDDHADALRDKAAALPVESAEAQLLVRLAREWAEDARTIRRALGIEIDEED